MGWRAACAQLMIIAVSSPCGQEAKANAKDAEDAVGREGPGDGGGEVLDDLPVGEEVLDLVGVGEFDGAEVEAGGLEGGDHTEAEAGELWQLKST